MPKGRITVSILDKQIHLYNKQIEEIFTSFFPYMKYRDNTVTLLKDRIFREDADGASVYYIFDRDNYKIIVIRDDEREVEKILNRTKGAIVNEVIKDFNYTKVLVHEYDDGLHIFENDVVVTDKKKPFMIKPRLLPAIIVYFATEKVEGGSENKDAVLSWKQYMSAIIFMIRLNFAKSIAEKVKMLYEAGKSIREVASDLNMSYSQVYYLLSKTGVELRRQRIPEHIKERILEMAEMGVPAYKIARELNLNEGTVLRNLRKEGLIKRKRKVTQEEINTIIQLYKEGKSIYEIAKRLGRSRSLVFYYLQKFADHSALNK